MVQMELYLLIGNTVKMALLAQEELEKKGKHVRVVDLYSLKPVDVENIVKCAMETQKLVSIEDHNIIGGMGSIIADVLTEFYPKKLVKLGVQDKFGKSGNYEQVYEMYGISVEEILKQF